MKLLLIVYAVGYTGARRPLSYGARWTAVTRMWLEIEQERGTGVEVVIKITRTCCNLHCTRLLDKKGNKLI